MKKKKRWLWRSEGHHGDFFDYTHSFPLFLSALPNVQNLSLDFTSALWPFSSSGSLRSKQSAACWSIMLLIGGISKMATISKGRKQRLVGPEGWGDGESEGRKRKLSDSRDLFSLEEGVSILHVRAKLSWQRRDKFCAFVCIWECVFVCLCVWACHSKSFLVRSCCA